MRHVVNRRRCLLADGHTPCLMHAFLDRCWFLLANFACKKFIGLWWCSLMLANANSANSIQTRHGRCAQALANSAYHWSMSLTQNAQDFVDATYRLPASMSRSQCTHPHRLCLCALVDGLAVGWRHMAKTCKPRPMLPSICTHAATNVCSSWIMLPSICQCPLATVCSHE